MNTIALIGCGRFGLALGTLAEEFGHQIRAYDPNQDPPEHWKEETLESCVDRVDFCVLAMPLSELESIKSLPGICIDVSSVKVESKRILEQKSLESGSLRYVCTHPLFGPRSVDEGERHLKWVLCPNEKDEEATAKVREFLKSLHVNVVEMSEENHDKTMAYTQALAFFLGRGLEQVLPAIAKDVRTPSAEALFRLVQSASGEKDHVGNIILYDNRYAKDIRRTLMESLLHIHANAPQQESMAGLRDEIDHIDKGLLRLFARRQELQKKISLLKKDMGKPVQDPKREESALAERQNWAAEMDLDGTFIGDVFELVLHWSRAMQEKIR